MVTREELLHYAQDEYDARGHDPQDKPIWVIMMIEYADKEHLIERDGKFIGSGFPDTGDSYDVGFYYDLDNAISAVESNACDIQEHIYQAAFILCRFQGLYPCCHTRARMYFVWDKEGKGFVQAEEPKIFKHVAY